jgi:hypothetical protein
MFSVFHLFIQLRVAVVRNEKLVAEAADSLQSKTKGKICR